MDEVSRTFIDSGGFGGLGTGGTLGIGALGGLVLGSLWNGNGFGFGGWGNNRGVPGVMGYDTGVLNGLQDSVNNISNQINSADRDFLMQTSNQNQFVGNLVNQTGDAIVGAVNNSTQTLGSAICNSTQNLNNAITNGTQTLGSAITSGNRDLQNSVGALGQTVQNGIFQNTLSQVQGQAATNLGMCQGFNGVNAGIAGSTAVLASGLADVNNNITAQNYENRLQAQQLANTQQNCCCQVLQAIEREGCANRELQREIQTQAIRDVLTTTQAENQSLKAQLFSTNAMAAQTATIINALKPATTTAG